MQETEVLEGSEAVAFAVKACRPQVISAYPISPQTHIVEALARMIADGEMDSEYVRVESEFSAASVISGASAAGSRSYTASSSQGLLLMTEVLYASAGMRLPFVITGVNRAISVPISIQVDHQDTISLRDSGVIQFYVESSQEAYDTHIAAFKIAEDPGILLPVSVCMDGWILTHSYERVSFLEQEEVDRFLPPFKPKNFLDVNDPKSWGSYAEEDVLMEFKYSIHRAMQYGKERIKEIFSELATITGRDHGGLIEAYRTRDAEVILVAMGSMVGTIKEAIDKLRSQGQRVGLIKIRCYRPFPFEDILDNIKVAKVVAVMDANFSMGSEGALGMDLKAKLCGRRGAPLVLDCVAGLGGREVNEKRVLEIVERAREVEESGLPLDEPYWAGLRPEILPEGAENDRQGKIG
ncbi:MAG: pyruvate ferredoxin oxidoreductase [Deltaproteobacteria bacterium]|nr:pyruvate ferredoxin oxidoreductase [Deltaproteobacteria bacterium]MBW1920900.1 pyruvate ferredoxin oxidoreductase [Deltaproteobacteria bacterium]MBW1931485.1 pyruvate ferredoxin oxidoreductase [Deltaproteobacteria bacterium]MBW1976717.1 pyruvate ferredoxin oxidoreductase [Deltaproteobacteria bacterium]MBW2044824.1 pyruvate ferredoxin oxidoreductase [Deltaproteobacteria bacterium]